MIRAAIRRLGALLWVTTILILAGCSRGVKDPDAWLRENISYLNDVVMRLRESSIIRVQSKTYEDATKSSSSSADAVLYDELKRFIDGAGVISISVVRRRDGRSLSGVSLHVKESWKPFEESEVSVVYTEPGEAPEDFFRKPLCTKASVPSWSICTWVPM